MQVSPFITIGITTYNRKQMLLDCINSILSQSFSDFEVLIGNDYVQEPLSLRELGVVDPRVRLVNHSANLGELDNMQYLLEHSRSEYFTWMADDDAYHPSFIRVAHDAFQSNRALDVVFTNFWSSDVMESIPHVDLTSVVVEGISVGQFLERYLTRQLSLIGCYGVFRTNFIKKLGGMRKAGTGFGPYSDNLLGIKAAGLGRVAYIDLPLIFYRIHGTSQSCYSDSIEAYTSAHLDLAQEFDAIAKQHFHRQAHARLKFYLLIWFIRDLAAVWGRNHNNLNPRRVLKFTNMVIDGYISQLPFIKYKMRLAVVAGREIFMLAKQGIRRLI